MYIHCTLRTVLYQRCATRMTHFWKHEAICIPSVLAEKRLVKTLLPRQGIFTIFLDLVSFINGNADFYIRRYQAIRAGREYWLRPNTVLIESMDTEKVQYFDSWKDGFSSRKPTFHVKMYSVHTFFHNSARVYYVYIHCTLLGGTIVCSQGDFYSIPLAAGSQK